MTQLELNFPVRIRFDGRVGGDAGGGSGGGGGRLPTAAATAANYSFSGEFWDCGVRQKELVGTDSGCTDEDDSQNTRFCATYLKQLSRSDRFEE